MKKKQYTAGQWAMMIAAAILIVAGAFGLCGIFLYINLRGEGAIPVHGTTAKVGAAVLFGCAMGAGVILCIISTAAARRCRKLLNTWDGEESRILDRLENRMDILNYLFECFFVIILLSAGFLFFVFAGPAGSKPGISSGTVGAVYVFSLSFGAIVLRGFQRNMQDEMNRLMESQNSCVYSSDFYRNGALNQWMKKSDEGQRQIVYKAAFRTYRNTIRILFFAMNLALICAGMRSAVGITAFLILGIIWLFMSASFCVERSRLKKEKN